MDAPKEYTPKLNANDFFKAFDAILDRLAERYKRDVDTQSLVQEVVDDAMEILKCMLAYTAALVTFAYLLEMEEFVTILAKDPAWLQKLLEICH